MHINPPIRQKWRKGSQPIYPPQRPLDRERKAKWKALVHCAVNRKRNGSRRDKFTGNHFVIATRLIAYLSEVGECYPSQARIAADTGFCEKTVRTTLRILRESGLLEWWHRVEFEAWIEGGNGSVRARQTSNGYVFLLPNEPHLPDRIVRLKRAPRSVSDCDGKFCREIKIPESKDMIVVNKQPAAAAQRALEAVRRRREPQIAANLIGPRHSSCNGRPDPSRQTNLIWRGPEHC